MIKITKNNWRPFIELTAIPSKEGDAPATFYFDVTRRPLIIQDNDCTVLQFSEGTLVVKESVKDIIKAVDKLIKQEQDIKAAQAREYMAATTASVESTKKLLEQ